MTAKASAEPDTAEYFAATLKKSLMTLFSPESTPFIPNTEAGVQLIIATVLAEVQRLAPIELAPRIRCRLAPEPEDPVERAALRARRQLEGIAPVIEVYLEEPRRFEISVLVEKD